MKYVLHVWTKDPFKTPWCVHFDGGPPEMFQRVTINAPCTTKKDGHTPCANWYIEGEAKQVYKDNDECEIW